MKLETLTSRQSKNLLEQLAGATAGSEIINGPIANDLRDLISAYPVTPVERYLTTVDGIARVISLKLEGVSPWGSIKGRTAIGLVASALGNGSDPTSMIESTSGNLGVALAALATHCGLRFTAVVDDRLPSVMRERIKGPGVRMVLADLDPHSSSLHRRISTANRLQSEDSGSIWLNQYENSANPVVHELWTAPEMFRQVPDMQAVFVAASTGGTLAGVSRATQSTFAACEVFGVDVHGSRALVEAQGCRVLTGIGASRRSSHLDPEVPMRVEVVHCWDGIDVCRSFASMTGRRLGGSSGAVLAACLRVLARRPDLTDVLCVCPDLGSNYEDTIYDDLWVNISRPAPAAAPLAVMVRLDDWDEEECELVK